MLFELGHDSVVGGILVLIKIGISILVGRFGKETTTKGVEHDPPDGVSHPNQPVGEANIRFVFRQQCILQVLGLRALQYRLLNSLRENILDRQFVGCDGVQLSLTSRCLAFGGAGCDHRGQLFVPFILVDVHTLQIWLLLTNHILQTDLILWGLLLLEFILEQRQAWTLIEFGGIHGLSSAKALNDLL